MDESLTISENDKNSNIFQYLMGLLQFVTSDFQRFQFDDQTTTIAVRN